MSVSPACRSCGHAPLEEILSLGSLPLANAFLTREELKRPEPTYPVDLAFCPQCILVQITETVPPEKLFRNYLYFSSFSDTALRYAQELVDRIISSRHLGPQNLVLEIASNDGYLLQYYQKQGVSVLGVEPAANVAKVAQGERGIRTLPRFFNASLAREFKDQGLQADVLHAHNVLAHAADLNDFVRGMRLLLKEDGIAVIEVPYVKELIERLEFDTIYHEHLCYFSLTALIRLFQRHGLTVQEVERIPLHGGSLRLFVAPGNDVPSSQIGPLLEEESKAGLGRLDFYQNFARKVEALKATLRQFLRELKQNGKRIAAYGAAAKGTVLLNCCGIGKETLDFVVDRNPYKQGRYMPGVHLPVYPPEKLIEEMPDYVLLLVWNLADEVMAQQSKYRERGGKFIRPLVEPQVVSS